VYKNLKLLFYKWKMQHRGNGSWDISIPSITYHTKIDIYNSINTSITFTIFKCYSLNGKRAQDLATCRRGALFSPTVPKSHDKETLPVNVSCQRIRTRNSNIQTLLQTGLASVGPDVWMSELG